MKIVVKSRFFFITYSAANVGLLLYGLLALVMPGVLLETFSAHVFQFPAEATGATAYLEALFRLVGFFNVLLGSLGLLILRGAKLAARDTHVKIVVLSTALAYVGPVWFDNTVGTIGVFEIVEHILFVAVLILGFLMLKQGYAVGSTKGDHRQA